MSHPNLHANIYTGFWTDWSRGAIMGKTLTLTRSQGSFLIAFTSFFIGYVALRLWHIVNVAFFRYYSTPEPRPALHYQRQLLLRNSSSAETGLFSLLALVWAWWKPYPCRRQLLRMMSPILIVAIVTSIGAVVAAGYSSTIASSLNNLVLLHGALSRCGLDKFHQDRATLAKGISDIYTASSYAEYCYTEDSTGLVDCNIFTKSKLTSSSDRMASCPFPNTDSCLNDTHNIRLDSGHLDMNEALGFNTPPDQSSSVRYVLQCAPLKTEGRTSRVSEANTTPAIRYHFGSLQTNGEPLDYTYSERNIESQYESRYSGTASSFKGAQFLLGISTSQTFQGEAFNSTRLFVPHRGLARSDVDLHIVFLSGNGVLFQERLDDAWYRATREGPRVGINNGLVPGPSFIPAEAASPLGCIEQYQFCNRGHCGPLASFFDAVSGAAPIFNWTIAPGELPGESLPGNSRDAARLRMLAYSGSFSTILNVVACLGSKSLASQSSLVMDGIRIATAHKSDSQWHSDVTHWFNICLALLQANFVNISFNPRTSETTPRLDPIAPTASLHEEFCSSQKIRSPSYTSFSVFGLVFVYVMGALVSLASFSLESVLSMLRRRYLWQQYQDLEWITSNPLQLHRLAQEGVGLKGWSKCAHDVPLTTAASQPLAALDIRDPDRPVLAKSLPISLKSLEPAWTRG